MQRALASFSFAHTSSSCLGTTKSPTSLHLCMMDCFSRNCFSSPLSFLQMIKVILVEVGLAMCVNRMCKHGLYNELHSIAYLHISFISSVDMESISSGIHGAEGLEAVQGFIQDYQLLVQAQMHMQTHYILCMYIRQTLT